MGDPSLCACPYSIHLSGLRKLGSHHSELSLKLLFPTLHRTSSSQPRVCCPELYLSRRSHIEGSSCTQLSHVTALQDNPAALKQDNTPNVTTHILLACFTYFTKPRSSSANLLKAPVIRRKTLRTINNNWSACEELNPFGSGRHLHI